MVLHPQLGGLDDSGVGIGGSIEVLGNCAAVVFLIDHPQTVDLCCLQGYLGLVFAHGIAFRLNGKSTGSFVISDFHIFAVGIGNYNIGNFHQTVDLLDAGDEAVGAFGQILLSHSGSHLNGETVVQLYAVDTGGVVTHLDDVVSAHALEEYFYSAQLPVGDVGHFLDVFQIGQITQVDVADFVAVGQREGGNFFVAQLYDELLLGLVQTGRSFHIGQLAVANLFFHIVDVFFLAFIGGVLCACGFVQGAPVGIGKDFLKDLLCLQGGLSSFEIAEPAMEPVQTQIGGAEESQNKQEVNGVEDDTADTGTLLLFFDRSRCFRCGSSLLHFLLGGIFYRCLLHRLFRLLDRRFCAICSSCGLFHRSGFLGGSSFLYGRCFNDFRNIFQNNIIFRRRLVQIIQET